MDLKKYLLDEKSFQWNVITNMFYVLTAMERDAFDKGKGKCDRLSDYLSEVRHKRIDSNFYYGYLPDECEKFRKCFGLPDMPDGEIFSLVDECMNALLANEKNVDDMHATVMYDFACSALLMSGEITVEDCENRLQKDVKRNCMAAENYAVYGEDTRYGKYVILNNPTMHERLCGTNLEDFKTLSPERQKNSPIVILYILSTVGSKAKDYICNPDALREYCIRKRNTLDNTLLESLFAVYGNDFLERKPKETQDDAVPPTHIPEIMDGCIGKNLMNATHDWINDKNHIIGEDNSSENYYNDDYCEDDYYEDEYEPMQYDYDDYSL